MAPILSEFELSAVPWCSSKSKLKKNIFDLGLKRKAKTDLNGVLPLLSIVLADKAREEKKNEEENDVENEALNASAPKFPTASNIVLTPTPLTKVMTAKFLAKTSKETNCRQLASTVRTPVYDNSYNSNEFLIANNYPWLPKHPAERSMYDTMRCEVYWRHRAKDVCPTLADCC